ncbi:conjugal transfer protein [Enterococcus sp. BWR-S5]|uniref:conjugal transfer protein n=1 Tax=Enterococcus sp. BWR-S5 TaxID=2787714 RepID=UPI001923A1A6|nr:conjugal transfer protein [Enterococcus sp. BWR-S5]MBL1226501.1 conjugal transfer protein [Enterococcus sp. BWR-S5]
MDLQKIVLVCLVLAFIVYMGFMFSISRKKKNGLGKSKKQRKKIVEQAAETYEPVQVVQEVASIQSDKELYTERGDRTHWYKVTIAFDTGDVYEYDFYSYSEDFSREEILNKRFYVNDREIMIVDETGEHYINRNKIEQIDFLERKVLVTETNSEESGDSFEEQIEEIEKEEKEIVEPDPMPEEETELIEEKEEIESALSKRGRFFKTKKVKRPAIKKMEVKKFNRIFMALMVFFLFSGVFSLFRTFGIGGRVSQVQAVQEELSEKVQSESGAAGESYPFEVNSFMKEFISEYIFLSADQDQMKARKENLKKFYASNVSTEGDELSTSRKLVASELSEIKQHEDYSTATYRVVYAVDIAHEEIKKEKNGDSFEDVSYIEYETQEKTVLMNIDFIEKENQYSIISTPYFSALSVSSADFEGVTKNEESGKALNADQLKELQTFLDIFFEKYATGTHEELQYFMKNVESLGGGYKVEAIESVEAFSHEEYTTVYVKVTFTEKDSGLKHKESFSLKLIKEEEQYKVNELKHNLGGF